MAWTSCIPDCRITLVVGMVLALGMASCSDKSVSAPGKKDDGGATADAVDAVTTEDAVGPLDVGPPKDVFQRVGKCTAGPEACDDDNPCTIDGCDPNVGCSSTPRDCSDSDPCTLDTCNLANGDCQHLEEKCDDGNQCTEGKCLPDEGCVFDGKDCSDGDACTSDGCSPQTGCVIKPLDCDDGEDCTQDSCDKAIGCVHDKPIGAKCCNLVGDCEDDNVCTVHACTSGICVTAPVFNCCQTDKDCDDGDSCTLDNCDKSAGACANIFKSGPGCCLNDSDCNDNDNCTLDRCIKSACGHETTCCKQASDCQPGGAVGLCDDATCTAAGCGFSHKSASGCCPDKLVAKTGFEAGDAWPNKLIPSTKGIWKIDDQASVAKNTAKAGTVALIYTATMDVIPGGQSVGRAILDTIELPAAARGHLSGWGRAQLLSGSIGDVFSLRAETAVGSWRIWTAKGSIPSWKKIEVDLSGFAARPATRKVRLVFEFVPTKIKIATSWVRVDVIEVQSTCMAGSCNVDSDCDDGLAATLEVCSEGVCVYKTQPEYCESNGACNDKNPCTTDTCKDLVCQHIDKPNCCTNSDQCKDENPCTTDYCSGLTCKHIIPASKVPPKCCHIPGDCDDGNPCTLDTCPVVGMACAYTKTSADCCVSDVDCDDGNKCSLDLCSKNKCSHKNQCCKTDVDCDDKDALCTADKCEANGICSWTPTGAAGCCEESMLKIDFEDGTTGGLALKNSAPATSKWQPVKGKKAKTGKGSLYYGNLAKGNFDDGATNGTVTSQPMEIAKGEKTVLAFSLYMDTESGTTYDKFEVTLIIGAKKYVVWTKKAEGFKVKAWVDYKVDLSAFGGQKAAIEFLFNTTDGIANNGEGVYLDDITLNRTCEARTCNLATECDDGQAVSTDLCKDGLCSYVLK